MFRFCTPQNDGHFSSNDISQHLINGLRKSSHAICWNVSGYKREKSDLYLKSVPALPTIIWFDISLVYLMRKLLRNVCYSAVLLQRWTERRNEIARGWEQKKGRPQMQNSNKLCKIDLWPIAKMLPFLYNSTVALLHFAIHSIDHSSVPNEMLSCFWWCDFSLRFFLR